MTTMGEFDMNAFWNERFGGVTRVSRAAWGGWSAPQSTSPQFVEPTLLHRAGPSPATARFIIIEAAGAVGKSSYAEALAATFGLALLDLALEGPVGSSTFVGGAYRFLGADGPRLIGDATVGVVIDALDEAQMKVPPESFNSFIADVIEASGAASKVPIVLLGRTAAAEDAYFALWERGAEPSLLSIEWFDQNQGQTFVRRFFDARTEQSIVEHRESYRKTAQAMVDRLRAISRDAGRDDDAFAGYAPVLSAVCSEVAAERNPAALTSSVKSSAPVGVLLEVCENILLREQKKLLDNLETVHGVSLPGGSEGYYSPSEQRDRIWSELYDRKYTRGTSALEPAIANAYDEAVLSFFGSHPFLNSDRPRRPANAVFSADLSARFLREPDTSTNDVLRSSADLRNPFFFDFYTELRRKNPGVLPMEHVGLLHASLRARSREGQRVLLHVAPESENTYAVDIRIESEDPMKPLRFLTDVASGNNLTLSASPISGVTIEAEQLNVRLGGDGPLTIEAPCYVWCNSLILDGTELSVIGQRLIANGVNSGGDNPQAGLIANSLRCEPRLLQKRPFVAPGVELLVSWPDNNVYPWTDFAADLVEGNVGDLDGFRRRLRHLLMTFRSHSRGRLMRYAAKIENARTTKGRLGVVLRDALLHDGVLTQEGSFYELHPDKLAEVLDVDYVSLRQGRTSARSDAYLTRLEAAQD